VYDSPNLHPLAILLTSQQVIQRKHAGPRQRRLSHYVDFRVVDYWGKVAGCGPAPDFHQVAGMHRRLLTIDVDAPGIIVEENQPPSWQSAGDDAPQLDGVS
jgi:hypothetical protein